MADILASLSLSASSFFTLLIAVLLAIIGVVFYLIYNSKYPLVEIIVFDRSLIRREKRRRVGDMLVKNSLLNIAINPHRQIGENYNDFSHFYLGGKKVLIARRGEGDTLIPIDISVSITKDTKDGTEREIAIWKLNDRFLLTSKKLAMAYINSNEEIEKMLDKTNPFIVGLLTYLPLIIAVALMLVGVITVLDFMAKTFQPMVNTLDASTRVLEDLSEKLINASNSSHQSQHVIAVG